MLRRYLKPTRARRNLIAGALADLGNIVAGALVFGQFVSEHAVSVRVFLFGIAFSLLFFSWAYGLSTEDERPSGI
jgi:hypothetical protein